MKITRKYLRKLIVETLKTNDLGGPKTDPALGYPRPTMHERIAMAIVNQVEDRYGIEVSQVDQLVKNTISKLKSMDAEWVDENNENWGSDQLLKNIDNGGVDGVSIDALINQEIVMKVSDEEGDGSIGSPGFYDKADEWPEDDYSREMRMRDMHGGFEPPSAADVSSGAGWGDVEDEWSPHHDPEIVQKDKINESFNRKSMKDFFRKFSY